MTKCLALIIAASLAALDQIIKHWVESLLAPLHSVQIIPGLFSLTYVQNWGAAFGILQGKTFFLTIVVALVLVAGLYLILSNRLRESFLIWTTALILAGGAGNLIDRVTRGYVVDYLDFSALFGFPVFNLADCCVVAGTLLLLGYVLWHDVFGKRGKTDEGEKEF